MRILVGNNALGAPGGSETYTYALISELVKKGHDVTAIGTGRRGIVAEKIEKLGVPVFLNKKISRSYDLILVSHLSTINLLTNVKGPKIQTCHGVYPKLEQPSSNVDYHIAISEEVQQHLEKLGFESKIIRNGVDCERFKPKNKLNENLKTILSLTHSEEANEILQKACKQIGVKFIRHNKFKMWSWDMEKTINKADLVVSLGRGAYEAMAAGRNIVIFDYRGYVKNLGAVGDGFVTKENVNNFLKNNCSGRFSNKQFNEKLLIEEFSKYHIKHGNDLRNFALENLNIETQTQKYLNLLNVL